MVLKMFLLAFSMLLIAKDTLGSIDCDSVGPFDICETPKVFDEIPIETSKFYDSCGELKSSLRCTKEYHDECGTSRIVLYHKPGLFEATYNTVSDVCEEGTMLNSVATENLKCLNETFSKTRCHDDADDFVAPLIKRAREDEEYELDTFCLQETYTTDCVLRALSENCGKLVEEATLEFVRRSKSLEYVCSARGAQTILNELDNLALSDNRKISMTLLLEKIVEENDD